MKREEKVYFVGAPGRIKIGYTVHPEKRLQSLQQIDMERLTSLAVIHGTRVTERQLHDLLRDYHIRGEWFKDCPEVRAVMARAIAGEFAPFAPVICSAAVQVPHKEHPTSFANRYVLPGCGQLADEVIKSLERGEDKYEVRAKADALLAVMEILLGEKCVPEYDSAQHAR
jgi:hypothetical protein